MVHGEHEKNPLGLYQHDWQKAGFPDVLLPYEGKAQLIYMDPPYQTGKRFSYHEQIAYQDNLKSDEFYAMMQNALMSAYRLLSETGSIYVHVDYRTVAHIRLMMDVIFGEEHFLNEIIWHYHSGGRAKHHFSRKHDNILFYSKTKDYYFDALSVGVPRGAERLNHMKKHVDENGVVSYSIKSAGKEYVYTQEDLRYPDDVWEDIPHLQQKDPERTGYETQKPEKLLERIVKASSKQGDLVADLFCGSGTTLSVAHQLDRTWLGIDKGQVALQVCKKRLLSLEAHK